MKALRNFIRRCVLVEIGIQVGGDKWVVVGHEAAKLMGRLMGLYISKLVLDWHHPSNSVVLTPISIHLSSINCAIRFTKPYDSIDAAA